MDGIPARPGVHPVSADSCAFLERNERQAIAVVAVRGESSRWCN